MAFRAEKASALAFGLILAVTVPAADLKIEVRHDHLRRFGPGMLVATDTGLTFAETGPKAKHKWTLAWPDIQQLWISPGRLKVLSYADVWWKLGSDREYELDAAPGATFQPLYSALKAKLDQRLVAALSDRPEEVVWRVAAKLRERFGGPEGTLAVGADRIVFESPEKGKSRTWRLTDIEDVSTSGPFDLTFTTFERSRGDYGDRRAFTFQLKERIDESHYNELWRHLNRSKQLEFINSARAETQ